MRKFINNIRYNPPTHFDQHEWNYLRYGITEISDRMYFRLSSGWELWIQNNDLNDREKYSRKYSKKITLRNVIFLIKENHSVYKSRFVLVENEISFSLFFHFFFSFFPSSSHFFFLSFNHQTEIIEKSSLSTIYLYTCTRVCVW